MQAGKRWKQRRVNVQNALREGADEHGREEAIESGETDQLDTLITQDADDVLVERLTARKGLVVHQLGGELVALGALERLGVCPVADHDADFRRYAAVFDRVDDRLQVGAATRGEDCQRKGFRHRCASPRSVHELDSRRAAHDVPDHEGALAPAAEERKYAVCRPRGNRQDHAEPLVERAVHFVGVYRPHAP